MIGTITSDATGDVVPGQLVTFDIPWTFFSSDSYYDQNGQLSVSFDPSLSFVGLVTGDISTAGDFVIDNVDTTMIALAQHNILRQTFNSNEFERLATYTGDMEELRVYLLSGFADECGFDSFPTGREDFDNASFDILYLQQDKSIFSQLYVDQFAYYQSLGYGVEKAHLHALVDTQTASYEYSYTHDTKPVIESFWKMQIECEGQGAYLDALQSGMSPIQAELQREQLIDLYTSYFLSQDIRITSHNINAGGDGGLLGNYQIGYFGWSLQQQYYTTDDVEGAVSNTISQTLSDAYATSL
ncbi:MAG: hypothetical protein H6766_01105 [Candidatus Peribacteria bacterium]|nr:MAG: hypothetical protein H6766_01105 [Candidatus Peribacteria bacterium]